jgi:DNA invertase Pin-like site-specific DNA recombinase
MSTETQRAAIYTRISKDTAGDGHGVSNQDADAGRLVRARGLKVVCRLSDNDISATSGRYRPAYAELMEAASRREFDVIIVWQSSRLWRNRRERAEGIEILRRAGVSVVAVKGPSLDMSTAYGRGMAGMLGEFDTMEAEVKGERQALAALARAEAGEPPRGTRLTGYTSHGAVIPGEAECIAAMFARFAAGDSLRGIAAWLSDSGLRARNGGRWNPSTVRTMLLNPRYAGRAIYCGAVLDGREVSWPAIVEPDLFDVVNAKLADPRRRNQTGTDRKYLGSGLYLCGTCSVPVVAHSGTAGQRYRCPAGHIIRAGPPIDQFVLDNLYTRLARPDLADLLAEPDGAAGREAAAEVRRLRARIAKIEEDYDAELIDGRRYKASTGKAAALLDQALAAQTRTLRGRGTAAVLRAADPVAEFVKAPLGVQRAVIGELATIRLDRAPRGRRTFDEATVRIKWNRHAR